MVVFGSVARSKAGLASVTSPWHRIWLVYGDDAPLSRSRYERWLRKGVVLSREGVEWPGAL